MDRIVPNKHSVANELILLLHRNLKVNRGFVYSLLLEVEIGGFLVFRVSVPFAVSPSFVESLCSLFSSELL